MSEAQEWKNQALRSLSTPDSSIGMVIVTTLG
jgi:hypothetical protein